MEVLDTNQESTVNFVREGIKIGVMNGVFALILMYGSYAAGLDTFVNVTTISTFIPYMIIVLLVYGFQLRKKNGGYMTFQEALKYTFVSYVIVELLVAIGTYILFIVIDPDLTQRVFEVSKDKMIATFEGLGQDTDKLEADFEKAGAQGTTLKTILLGFGGALIWQFVKSLLLSLILRRTPPPF